METRHEEKPWGSCGEGALLPQSRQPPSFLRTRPEGQHRRCHALSAVHLANSPHRQGQRPWGRWWWCVWGGGLPSASPAATAAQRRLGAAGKGKRAGGPVRVPAPGGCRGGSASTAARARPPLPFSPAPSPPRRLLPSELPASMLPQ